MKKHLLPAASALTIATGVLLLAGLGWAVLAVGGLGVGYWLLAVYDPEEKK